MKNTEKKEIKLLGWGNDGVVSFLISNKTYRYNIDSALIPWYVKKFKRQPWTVFNEIKQVCSWWIDNNNQIHENTKEV